MVFSKVHVSYASCVLCEMGLDWLPVLHMYQIISERVLCLFHNNYLKYN